MNIKFDNSGITIKLDECEARNLAYQLSHSIDILREDRDAALRWVSRQSDDYDRISFDYNYHIDNNIEIREQIADFIDHLHYD